MMLLSNQAQSLTNVSSWHFCDMAGRFPYVWFRPLC
jgi:hypothetical protein